MNIVLATVADEANRISKTLDNITYMEGTLKQETSVINPTILFEATNLSGFNYMYINEFHRYYFITDIVCVRKNLWQISAKVDVLMSFRDGIYSCPIILSDTEEAYVDKYMLGDMWQTLVKSKTDIINFPSGLNNTGEYILITSGG